MKDFWETVGKIEWDLDPTAWSDLVNEWDDVDLPDWSNIDLPAWSLDPIVWSIRATWSG